MHPIELVLALDSLMDIQMAIRTYKAMFPSNKDVDEAEKHLEYAARGYAVQLRSIAARSSDPKVRRVADEVTKAFNLDAS